jgi:hypothetical protein
MTDAQIHGSEIPDVPDAGARKPFKRRPAGMLPLLLAATMMSCGAVILAFLSVFYFRPASTAGKTYGEAEVAYAYVCAYRYGQMDTMNNLPSIFVQKEQMSDDQVKSCAVFKDLAEKHGHLGAAR